MDKEENPVLLANEYFKQIKDNLSKTSFMKIDAELKTLPETIEDLKSLGQRALAENLERKVRRLVKERIMVHNGFDTYVSRQDITKFIDKVKDIVVKVEELEYYPRVIPNKPKALLKKAQALGVFSAFWVVFTDYTENEVKTEEEKQIRAKNRDPIIFGTIGKGKQAGLTNKSKNKQIDEQDDDPELNTFYFICDWEDEFCDVTLDKMVEVLSNDNEEYFTNTIVKDWEGYVNSLITIKKKHSVSEWAKSLFGAKK